MTKRLIVGASVTVMTVALLAQSPVTNSSSQSSSPSTGVTVRGRMILLYPDSGPVRYPPQVALVPDLERGELGPGMNALVAADGAFEFKDVLPGAYELAGSGSLFQKVKITVARDDVSNVVVPYAASIPVTFRVAMDDGSPIPSGPGFMGVFALKGHLPLSFSVFTPTGVTTQQVVPGDVFLFVRPREGYFVKSLTYGSADLIHGPLSIKPGDKGATVELTMTRTVPTEDPMSRVTGRLTGDHPDMEVSLADTTAFGLPRGSFPRYTRTRADSSFEFANVPPGLYNLDVPPASHVKDGIIVTGGDVGVDVEFGEGQVVTGQVNRFAVVNGQRQPRGPEPVSVRFTGLVSKSIRASSVFWTVIPPGEYTVTVEDLRSGTTVANVSAGSVDLLARPLVVPPDRPAERITIGLRAPQP